MYKKILFIILLLFLSSYLISDELKKTIPDSIPRRSGTKAMLYSLSIPGGGQFYNKKYLKSGVEFAAESIIIGYIMHFHIKMDEAYNRYAQNPGVTDYYDRYSSYYKKRQSMVWWLCALKFMSVVDAFVDAKLYNYEAKKKKIELRFKGNSASLSYKF